MKRFGDYVVQVVKKHPGLPLMLNFERVAYLSSAALTELLRVKEKLDASSGALRVCGLSSEIYKVFEITKLDRVFEARRDEAPATAMDRFRKDVDLAQRKPAGGAE